MGDYDVTIDRNSAVLPTALVSSTDTKPQESSIISKVAGVATPILSLGSYLRYAKYVPGLSNVVDCDGLARVGEACSNVTDIQKGASALSNDSGSTIKKACSLFNTVIRVAKFAAPMLPEAASVAVAAAAANPVLGMVGTALWAGSAAYDIYRCIRG